MQVSAGRNQLMEQDLQPTIVKMLEYNQIPGVLDVSIEKVDFQVKLYYKITGRRLLSQELKTNRLKARPFFQLLVRIGSIIEEARAYYLDESRFALNCGFIFVGQDIEDLKLVYLPIVSIEHGFTPQEQWRELILELLEYVDDLHVDELRGLLGDLKRSDWTLSQALKNWIHKLTDSGPLLDDFRQVFFQEDHLKSLEEAVPNEQHSLEDQAAILPAELGHRYVKKLVASEQEGDSSEAEKVNGSKRLQKMKLSILMALILAAASLLTSIPAARYSFLFAMFFCISLAGLLYWRESIREQRGELDWEVDDEQDFSNDLLIDESMIDEQSTNSPSSVATTSVLRQADVTTFLQKSQDLPFRHADVFLERVDDGHGTRRKLESTPFVIGRESSVVDWSIDIQGISRMHCEIVKAADEYQLKDLGSKNGSYLNGELLVPYKTYRLTHQDRIRIAHIEFMFIQEEMPAKM